MRGNATVTVTCDTCSDEQAFELTSLAQRGSWDERNLDRSLEERAGWKVEDDGDYCPNCWEEDEDDEDEGED